MSTKSSDSKRKSRAKSAIEKKPKQRPENGRKSVASANTKPKRVSALDAAAKILKSTRKPMRAQELIEAMAESRLWSSPNGKTPHATLSAAMQREIKAKAGKARFVMVDRGLFASNN